MIETGFEGQPAVFVYCFRWAAPERPQFTVRVICFASKSNPASVRDRYKSRRITRGETCAVADRSLPSAIVELAMNAHRSYRDLPALAASQMAWLAGSGLTQHAN